MSEAEGGKDGMIDVRVPEVVQESPASIEDEGGRRRADQDEIIVAAVAAGKSYREAGELAGVTARTVGRRMTEPDFLARVSRRRGERVSEITGGLASMGSQALDVLRECMSEGRPADRLRAAQLTLSLMAKLRQDIEIEERISALEQNLAPGGGQS